MKTTASVPTGPVHLSTVLPGLDPFSQSASGLRSQIGLCTLLLPTYGLCSHIPGNLGDILDRKTGGFPCNYPSNCHLLLPKGTGATFSAKLQGVRTHPSWNSRSEKLVVPNLSFCRRGNCGMRRA